MVFISEIEDKSVANTSKGKLPRQYINLSNTNEFYINKEKEIFRVNLEIDKNNAIKSISLYNGSDNTKNRIKQNNVTCIVTNIGVVTMTITGNILYFSKPNDILVYA